MTKCCLATENNQLKSGDYSLLFSMHADDNEHFNYQWPKELLAVYLVVFEVGGINENSSPN